MKTENYHHGDLRRALLERSLEEVEQRGHEAVRLSTLVKSLGVSQPAIYRHFENREALMAATAALGFEQFSAWLAQRYSKPGSTLLSICRRYVDFGLKRPGLYRLMFASELLSKAEDGSDLRIAADTAFDILTRVIGGDPASTELRAMRVFCCLHGIVSLGQVDLLKNLRNREGLDALIDGALMMTSE